MIIVESFKFNPFEENCYLIYNDEFKESDKNCILIDPGQSKPSEFERLNNFMSQKSLKPAAILLTHLHFDHIGGASVFKNIPIYMSKKDWNLKGFCTNALRAIEFGDISLEFDTINIEDGNVLSLAGMEVKCIATPGHSAGSFSYLIEDKLFSGDTLFAGAIGRSDLPSGEYDELIVSIMEKLILLDSDTIIYPGHGPSSTIGYERYNNPFLEPFNEKEELDYK